jgi:hypothetical protein
VPSGYGFELVAKAGYRRRTIAGSYFPASPLQVPWPCPIFRSYWNNAHTNKHVLLYNASDLSLVYEFDTGVSPEATGYYSSLTIDHSGQAPVDIYLP